MWVLASGADVEHEWALHREWVVLGKPRQHHMGMPADTGLVVGTLWVRGMNQAL